MKSSIILIGYRGVGKSTIAELVSKQRGFAQLSLDKELAKKIGNLQEFIKAFGWERFREEESALIAELKADNTVIDCGGGVVENPDNMELLTRLGTIFYLYASPATIRERLATTTKRLSLSGKSAAADEIEAILQKRDPLYRRYADLVIETDTLTQEETAELIITHTQR